MSGTFNDPVDLAGPTGARLNPVVIDEVMITVNDEARLVDLVDGEVSAVTPVGGEVHVVERFELVMDAHGHVGILSVPPLDGPLIGEVEVGELAMDDSPLPTWYPRGELLTSLPPRERVFGDRVLRTIY